MNIDIVYPKILIDSFKNQDEEAFSEIYGNRNNSFVRCFKSSGTTKSISKRSHSYYTQQGIEAYELSSWKHFESILHHIYPRFKARDWIGLSLIPPSTEWQDSSLAHMVSLFVKKSHWKSQFIQDLEAFFSWFENFDMVGSNEPIWVFGTAAHFLNLIHSYDGNIEQGKFRIFVPKELASRIFLFETGGFKNVNTGLDRAQYLDLLARFFGISTNQIISEYGMSELASQAYDLASFKYGSEERYFHSNKNMNCYVLQRDGRLSVLGKGCLVVRDENRIDVTKYIVTQDVVEIWAPNCFRLLGRLLRSDKRGCSLNVQVVDSISQNYKMESQEEKSHVATLSCTSEIHSITFDKKRFENRVNQIEHFFIWLKEDVEIYQSFLKEFESPFLVAELLKDLLICIPKTCDEWLRACMESGIEENSDWLIVPPANHSIASLQVICLALVSGSKLQVRLPREFDNEVSSLKIMLRFLQKLFPTQLEILGSKFRFVNKDEMSDSEIVYLDSSKPKIVFGESLNSFQIDKIFEKKSKFFGHRMGVTYIENLDHNSMEQVVQKCCHDAFAMFQNGCMSSRYIFINKDVLEENKLRFLESLSQESKNYLRGSISDFHNATLDYYAEHLRKKFGNKIKYAENLVGYSPLISLFVEPLDLRLALEFMEFEKDKAPSGSLAILPIDRDSFLELFSKEDTLFYLYTEDLIHQELSKKFLSKLILPLGAAHQISWDGKHEGKRIFA